MVENSNNISGIFNKVKTATQQMADATVRKAKIARLRFDIMALHSERARHLQNIGSNLFSLHKQKQKFDQTELFSQLQTEIDAIESIDKRIEVVEAQLQAQQADSIEVKDITPN
jgi:hypothetical protein